MPSRADLELRAATLNITPSSYPNDSTLEQKVIYANKAVVAAGDAIHQLPSAVKVAQVAGGQNV